MPCYVGLDVGKQTTSICVIDESATRLKEGVVESTPKAIVAFLRGEGRRYRRIGIEAGTQTTTIYVGLAKAGLPIICVETWHTSRILKSSRINKTDKNDAAGIAEMMRANIYKSVHIKTDRSRQIMVLLSARKMLQTKMIAIQNHIGELLLTFGIRYKRGRSYTFGSRIQEAAKPLDNLSALVESLLAVHEVALTAINRLNCQLSSLAAADPVCCRLMTAPGVGPLVALTYMVAIDEPGRFPRSRDVAAHLGLTPRTRQSGQRDSKGRISRSGDAQARAALYMAASCAMRTSTKQSDLKSWGQSIAARRGKGKALVAVARRLAVTLHRMWISETDFRLTAEA